MNPRKLTALLPETRRFLAQLHGSIAEAYLSYVVEFPGQPLVPEATAEQYRAAERLTLFAMRRIPVVHGKYVTNL